MDREEFIDELCEELEMFHNIANRDLEKGILEEEAEEVFVKYVPAFYAARSSIDKYAEKKGVFAATYALQIIKGANLSNEIVDLCNEIEDEKISDK